MDMQNWYRFIGWFAEKINKVITALPMRPSFFVALVLGLTLVYFAVTSQHPLATKWVDTIHFEYGNRFLCLVMLYLSHRIINSEIRTHRLLDELNHKVSSAVFVAWSATWVLSCALIIAFVR